ncbi:hypothetical protein J4216_03270 [Candidatus Woesearchaeota archaeon]|nr:hypothetical protein [Candidatus Woesearchaeota archaeon]
MGVVQREGSRRNLLGFKIRSNLGKTRKEALVLWDSFLDSLNVQLLNLVATGETDFTILSSVSQGIEGTHDILLGLMEGDSRNSIVEEEYNLFLEIKSKLENYNPIKNADEVADLAHKLRNLSAKRKRIPHTL